MPKPEADPGLPSESAPFTGEINTVDELDPATRDAIKALQEAEDDDYEAEPSKPKPKPDMTPEEMLEAAEEEGEEEVVDEEGEEEGEDDGPDNESAEEEEAPSSFGEALQKLRETESRIDAKKKELEPLLERISAHDKRKDQWATDRVGVIRSLIADYLGTDDPAKISEEEQALYDDFTLTVLDIPATPEKKQQAKIAQLEREVAAAKREREAEAQRLKDEKAAAEHQAAVTKAVSTFNAELAKTEDYPYLKAATGNQAGEVIWGVISGTYEREEKELGFAEAASIAEQHFQTEAQKYQHLFAGPQREEPSTEKPKAPSKKRKKKRGITNAAASEAGGSMPRGHIDDDEESIARSLKLLRQKRLAEESED